MMGLPSCREAAARLSREQDQPARRSWGLRVHLWLCRSCRRYARQLQWLRAALHTAARRTQLSETARARIRTRLARVVSGSD